jgi:hypothetical protein
VNRSVHSVVVDEGGRVRYRVNAMDDGGLMVERMYAERDGTFGDRWYNLIGVSSRKAAESLIAAMSACAAKMPARREVEAPSPVTSRKTTATTATEAAAWSAVVNALEDFGKRLAKLEKSDPTYRAAKRTNK